MNISKDNNKKVQVMTGKVISSRNHCTIVAIERIVKHPKYGKFIQHRKKYKAHDLVETRNVGDKISIVPCRPISKDKRFKVVEIK